VRQRRLAPFIRSPDIPSRRGQKVWIGGILVTGKEVATKKSEPMIFVSFEDEESVFETVLFPDSFRRHFALLDEGWAFLIHGRVDEDLGALAITVETLVQMSRRAGEGEAVGAAPPDVGAAPERPPVFMWGSKPPNGVERTPAAALLLPRAAG
jgi:DNA polymerase III alpha subunit